MTRFAVQRCIGNTIEVLRIYEIKKGYAGIERQLCTPVCGTARHYQWDQW